MRKASKLLDTISFWVYNLNHILSNFNIPIMTFIFISKPYGCIVSAYELDS